ncbi:uncharacterized protein LOC120123845 [Hibiscus syriacus]|uniref:uncharacterized protein LOC120123845 n=1 Tax=Hibiscus syriacus TaxID=106335 RepID=UPI001924A8F6|nr:uncharacterized protein LOC120123845 [Hibiscus syriacus]
MLTASVTAPLPCSLSNGHRLEPQICSGCCVAFRIPTRIRPRGLSLRSQPIVGRRRKQCLSINATCSASGQTQTVIREAPTITQAPVHCNNKHILSIICQMC